MRYGQLTYRIYIDFPWSMDVRKYDAPMRIYVHAKHWMWIIGLWPTIKSQKWNATEGYTDKWSWITYSPKGSLHPASVCGTPQVVLVNHRRRRKEAEEWLKDIQS